MLDVQKSAQGRNQPVASVALLVAVKPPLTNRLADEFQGAAAVLSLPKPIERLSRPVMATHTGVPRGLGGGLFASDLVPDRSPNRALLPKFRIGLGRSRLSHAMHWPDAFAQNSERTARRVPPEQAKNRARGPSLGPRPDRSMVSPSHPAGPSWYQCGSRCRLLSFAPHVMVPTKEGDRCFPFSGIVIPWTDGDRLTRIKIRRFPDLDRNPRYAQAYSDHPLIYPDPVVIQPGKPLIICEGEFDAMLLAQQLPEASVITLGSASARTDPAVLSRMLSSPRWFVALDADQAGDSAASKFPARAIRVRPPDKDWGEIHAGGSNRVRYLWGRYLSMSQSWEQLESLRWGPP